MFQVHADWMRIATRTEPRTNQHNPALAPLDTAAEKNALAAHPPPLDAAPPSARQCPPHKGGRAWIYNSPARQH